MTLATGSFAIHLALISIALTPLPTRIRTSAALPPLQVKLVPMAVPQGLLPAAAGITQLPGPVAIAPEDLLLPLVASAADARTAYMSTTMLERRPTPVSESDISILQKLKTSGLPVRLRIYVDRFGKVAEVVTLEAGLLDEEFVNGLRLMFLATAFLPGRHAGIDVPSYMDIELVGQ